MLVKKQDWEICLLSSATTQLTYRAGKHTPLPPPSPSRALPEVLGRQSFLQLYVQCHAFCMPLVAAVSDCSVVSSTSGQLTNTAVLQGTFEKTVVVATVCLESSMLGTACCCSQ